MAQMRDETGLDKNAANFVALTPLSHLKRASYIFPDRLAVAYGTQHRKTYAEYHARVSALASALSRAGVQPGDVVATLLPNIPAHCEAHFAVPATGAVLNAINTRLDIETIRYIFEHGEAKMALVDTEFLPSVEALFSALAVAFWIWRKRACNAGLPLSLMASPAAAGPGRELWSSFCNSLKPVAPFCRARAAACAASIPIFLAALFCSSAAIDVVSRDARRWWAETTRPSMTMLKAIRFRPLRLARRVGLRSCMSLRHHG